MIGTDIWSGLWLLVDQYPWVVAIFVVLVLCFIGTVVACALLALSGSQSAPARRLDDEEQQRLVTRPTSLDNWRRSGGNWHGEL